MSKSLTVEDIENAAQTALNNFGAPNQIFIANGSGFASWYDQEPGITLAKVREHFFGMLTIDVTPRDAEVCTNAARAFHNIGFDIKKYTP